MTLRVPLTQPRVRKPGGSPLLDGKGLHEIPLTATSTLAHHSARAVCGFPEVDWGPLEKVRGDDIRTLQGQEGPLSLAFRSHAFPSRPPHPPQTN